MNSTKPIKAYTPLEYCRAYAGSIRPVRVMQGSGWAESSIDAPLSVQCPRMIIPVEGLPLRVEPLPDDYLVLGMHWSSRRLQIWDLEGRVVMSWRGTSSAELLAVWELLTIEGTRTNLPDLLDFGFAWGPLIRVTPHA